MVYYKYHRIILAIRYIGEKMESEEDRAIEQTEVGKHLVRVVEN